MALGALLASRAPANLRQNKIDSIQFECTAEWNNNYTKWRIQIVFINLRLEDRPKLSSSKWFRWLTQFFGNHFVLFASVKQHRHTITYFKEDKWKALDNYKEIWSDVSSLKTKSCMNPLTTDHLAQCKNSTDRQTGLIVPLLPFLSMLSMLPNALRNIWSVFHRFFNIFGLMQRLDY